MAKFFNDSIEGTKTLNALLKETEKTLKELVKINKESVSKVNTEKSKADDVKKLTEAERILLKTEKDLIANTAKITSLRKGEQDALIKSRATLQEETKAVKESIKARKSLTPQYDKARKKLAAMQKQLIEVSLGEKKMSSSTKKLARDVAKLNNQISGAEQLGGRFQRQVGKYPKLLTGAALAAGGAFLGFQAFTRVLGSAVGIAKDFEQGNANLASVLGVSRKEIVALTDDAMRLGAATSFSATEVSGLQTEFAKLGFNQQEILDATEATLNLAAATGSELGEAAAIAGATLGGFGLNAKETGRITDVMAKSFSTSALDLEKFKESMKTAAPAAKAVGVSVEDTTALLGTMANAGVSGSKAGNALKNTFINLNAAGLTMNQGFDKVNKSSDKLGTAVKLVGKEAATAFLIMADGVDETEKLANGLRNAGGAAEKMANEQLDTLEGSLKILNSAWEGFVLGLLSGEGAFASISRSMVGFATSVLGLLTTTEGINKEWLNQRDNLGEVNDRILENSDRHDELKDKTELNKDEQIELDEIIKQLAIDVPEAASAFDEYGNITEINTEKTREFAEAQRNLILVKNAEKIKEQSKLLKGFETQLKQVSNKYRETADGLKVYDRELSRATNGQREWSQATAEDISGYNERLLTIKENISGTKQYIAELKGIKSAAELAADAESERNEANKEQIETLRTLGAALSVLKNERLDINKLDKEALKINKQKSDALQREIDLINGKIKAQRKDPFLANEKRRIQLIEDLEKKAFEKEQLRFTQELKSAKKNGEDLELVELIHQQKLEAIRKEFELKRVEALESSTKTNRKLNTTAGNDLLKQSDIDRANAERLAKEKLDREIQLAKDVTSIFGDELLKRNQLELDALKKKESDLESEVARQQQRADEGLSNSLATQKALLDKNRIEQIEKEKQASQILEAQKLGELFITLKEAEAAKNVEGSTGRALVGMAESKAILTSIKTAVKAFKDGGLVEGGDQLIRINEEGQEFVLDASTTKAMGLDKTGSNMGDFKNIMSMHEMKQDKVMQDSKVDYRIIKSLDNVVNAINNKPVYEPINFDKFGNLISVMKGKINIKRTYKTGNRL